MTLKEVADYLHCHYFNHSSASLGKRAIPGFRLGSDWRFSRSALDKWIEGQTIVCARERAEKGDREEKVRQELHGGFASGKGSGK
jgi:excisionase family DNA binding protein